MRLFGQTLTAPHIAVPNLGSHVLRLTAARVQAD
jgi:hypothetical protein